MKRTHGPASDHPAGCFGCHVLTIQISPQPWQAHYNWAVGDWVTNERDFHDKLKRLGDIQSERTGISATYEPIHPADLRASPPPEAAPSHLERLVAHDDDGRPMHRPVDADPTLSYHVEQRRQEYRHQQEKAAQEAETADLIPEDDHAE